MCFIDDDVFYLRERTPIQFITACRYKRGENASGLVLSRGCTRHWEISL
jgi:hypothetical protein